MFAGTDKLKKNLLEYFDENECDETQYKQWTTTDRSQLETITESTEEFVETFIEKLQVLSRHDFVAKEQSNYLKDRKTALKEGEVLVLGDFSENYTFIIQDAIQGYHWTSTQATLHPYVYYINLEGVGLKYMAAMLSFQTAICMMQWQCMRHSWIEDLSC